MAGALINVQVAFLRQDSTVKPTIQAFNSSAPFFTQLESFPSVRALTPPDMHSFHKPSASLPSKAHQGRSCLIQTAFSASR